MFVVSVVFLTVQIRIRIKPFVTHICSFYSKMPFLTYGRRIITGSHYTACFNATGQTMLRRKNRRWFRWSNIEILLYFIDHTQILHRLLCRRSAYRRRILFSQLHSGKAFHDCDNICTDRIIVHVRV